MNLQEAQHKLSADISQLYETYQLISKSKQQFNDLDVALLQQQLLYVYHSLLKVQGQLAAMPQSTVLVEEVLPLVGLKPEPVEEPVIMEEEIVIPVVEEKVNEEVVIPEVVEETPVEQGLNFNFKTMPEGEQEPTLEDLEKIMQQHEQEEQEKVQETAEDVVEPAKVQTTLSFEAPAAPVVKQTPSTEPQAEVSLLDKLSATIRTNTDVVEKIAKEQQQSLKQAINLNRKIAFVNNLFNENTVEYAKAIEKLNACSSLHEALRYFNELKHQYNWSNESALVKDLESLIEKRYS